MKRLFCLLLLVWLAPLPVLADFDPPGRVARVGWIDGNVFLRNAHYVEWQRLAPNWPVTSGDVLWTAAGARLELRVGSTALRLDSGSEIEVVRIDDDVVSVMLHSGSAAVQLRDDVQASGFSLRTAAGNATPLQAGRYRFDRSADSTVLSVREGRLSFAGSAALIEVGAGQRIEIGNYAGQMHGGYQDWRNDHFADWVDSRERHDEARLQPRYVSPDMTGYEDLHDHGQWAQHEEFGVMWYPARLPVGWAPYRSGRWVWVAPWGWNWVDDAPWGFAPFHYGRWVQHHGRWAWVPGRYVARPVYAPALVVWIGAAGFPTVPTHHATPVGWFPLGPREIFVPGYRVTPRYERKLNAGHLDPRRARHDHGAVAPGRYRNHAIADAVTVVPATVVSDARPVAPARLVQAPRPDATALTAAPVLPRRPSPARGTVPGSDQPQLGRPFIAPPAVAPAPEQRALPPAQASAIERRPPPPAPARALPAAPPPGPSPAPAASSDRLRSQGGLPSRDPRLPPRPAGAGHMPPAATPASDRHPPERTAAGMPPHDSRATPAPVSEPRSVVAPPPAAAVPAQRPVGAADAGTPPPQAIGQRWPTPGGAAAASAGSRPPPPQSRPPAGLADGPGRRGPGHDADRPVSAGRAAPHAAAVVAPAEGSVAPVTRSPVEVGATVRRDQHSRDTRHDLIRSDSARGRTPAATAGLPAAAANPVAVPLAGGGGRGSEREGRRQP